MASRFRIGVVLQGGPRWVGGVEYTKNLLKALYALAASGQARFEVVPFAMRPIDSDLYADMPAQFHNELRVGKVRPLPTLGRQLRTWLGLNNPRLKPSLAEAARRHGVHFLYPYARQEHDPRRPRAAAWVPDFQHRHLPEFFGPEDLELRDARIARDVSVSRRVVLSSAAAARDFARYFPKDARKARVLRFRTVAPAAWYAPTPAEIVRKYDLPERFFIVCNQFWRHKNHRAVFAALALLAGRGVRPTVVCTGSLSDFRYPDIDAWVRGMLAEFGVAGQVRLLGLIPRLDQIQLVRYALAVIQPSLFEGWSTVVEDARALGKTIALSTLDVHREQDPPRAAFFDPHAPEALAEILAGWWTTLTPGPDPAAEAAARARGQSEQLDFARSFLELARAA